MSRPDLEHLDERQFTLAIKILAESLAIGMDASPFQGAGVDYIQSRHYVPGDSIRSIDWRTTARSGRTHVKEYESLKQLPVHLVVDATASMHVGMLRRTKWNGAVVIASALMLAAIRRHSPVSLVCNAVDARSPATFVGGPATLRADRVLQWTAAMRAASANGRRRESRGDYADCIARAMNAAREPSLIVLIGDFNDPGIAQPIRRLAQLHEVIALRLLDAADRKRPRIGFLRARRADGEERFDLGPGIHRDAPDDLLAGLRTAGIASIELHTESDFVPALRTFLAFRHVQAGGHR